MTDSRANALTAEEKARAETSLRKTIAELRAQIDATPDEEQRRTYQQMYVELLQVARRYGLTI